MQRTLNENIPSVERLEQNSCDVAIMPIISSSWWGWTFAASSSHSNHLAVTPRWMVPSDCHRHCHPLPIVRLQAMGKYRYLYLLKRRIYGWRSAWSKDYPLADAGQMVICHRQSSSSGRRPDGHPLITMYHTICDKSGSTHGAIYR